MSQRRERFITSLVGVMLGIVLIMALVKEIGLVLWYIVSYIGFVGPIVYMNMLSLSAKPRRRLLLLLGLGGVGFIIVRSRTALQLI